MLRIITTATVGLVVSCGEHNINRNRCIAFGEDCPKRTLEVHETVINEAVESSKDGLDGQDGVDGISGIDGLDGKSCMVEQTSTGAIIKCEDGSEAVINHGVDGLAGQDGTDGIDGADGQDGQDGTNGQDGVDGQDGADAPVSPFSIVEVIDPCGKQTAFDEVLLRLANGQLIAYFSMHGGFLAILGPGNYITTDGTNCTFKVHPDLTVTY